MKSAVVYSRVSTQRQAIDGVSMDAQLSRARAWATAMGYEIVGEYQDAGISGKAMTNRPALQSALDHACSEKSALIVYSLSRLARSTKDAILIGERLDKAGADLVSLSEDIRTDTAAGKMIFRMLNVLAEFEADLIGERTRTALQHKREQGFKTGGSVPFGFDVDANGKLIENDIEQKAIELIEALRSDGYSLRDIGRQLERDGITTKGGKKKWHAKTIKGILDRAA